MGREHDHSLYENWIDPGKTVPYEKNAKIHTDKQVVKKASAKKKGK